MLYFFCRRLIKSHVLSFFIFVFCLINLGGWQAARGGIRLDYTFAPVLLTPGGGPDSALVLPDGKLIVIRQASQSASGALEYKVTRLNADGSVDQIFNVVMSAGSGKLLLLPDGKILVMYSSILVNGENRGGLVRLNQDGTLDTTFNAPWVLGAVGAAALPDGRIIVGARYFDSTQGITVGATTRVNLDGSRDMTFQAYERGFIGAEAIAIQPDGKILVGAGRFSDDDIVRLNPNGVVDTAFTNNLPASWATYHVASIIIQPDGKIVVGGANIIRLNPDGTGDETFTPGNLYYQYQVFNMVRQPDGKIVIGGSPYYFNALGSIMKKRLSRINTDGTQDITFDAMTNEQFGFDTFTPLAIRPNGTILVTGATLQQNNASRNGLISLSPGGTIDESFNYDAGDISGSVNILAKQPDGKILAGGYFTKANNFSTPGLTRLNRDGMTDTDFSFSTQISGTISVIVFQTDGKILIGGNLRFNNQNNYGVIRLNANGSRDTSFTPRVFSPNPNAAVSGVNGLALQADGKILVGGVFLNYGSSGRNNFVRLNSDGSVDTAYNVTSNGIFKMLVQPGGKIVVTGGLTFDGIERNHTRLNSDGSFDASFSVPNDVGGIIAVAPDGRLASSGFFTVGKNSVPFVFRLNVDGSRDTTFTATAMPSSVGEIVFQHDGRMIVRSNQLIRLNLNGGIETTFAAGSANARALLITSYRELIVGGFFNSLDGVPRTGIARYFLVNKRDYDFDGDGKADIAVFRPSVGDWYLSRSSDGEFVATHFGAGGDLIAPADFDGDSRTDIAVFRPADGAWYRLNSSDNTFSAVQYGASGDLPVPGDFDGDGKSDISIYRPSAGAWYRIDSSTNQSIGAQFGIAEDKPIVGDFDGDGKADLTVFRPSNGSWYRINSSNNQFVGAQFGIAEDKPVAADYDGDEKTDLAVYRPSTGSWYRINSSNNSFAAGQFGIAEDKPSPADFDGDGKSDLAVFRPSTGTWYLLRSTAGFTGAQFGTNGDIPTPNAFVR